MANRKPYVNPLIERATRDLAKDFADAFRELERYLVRNLGKLHHEEEILQHDLYNIRGIRDTIKTLQLEARKHGFKDVIEHQAGRLKGLAKAVLEEARELGIGAGKKFSATTAEDIKSLLYGAQRELLGDETKVARDLERILLRSTTGVTRWDDLIGNLQRTMDVNQRQAITKAEDTIAAFHTQTRVQHFGAPKADGKPLVSWWLYDGPRDERNRDWCAHFIGTRVTTEIIVKHATSYGRRHPLPPSVSLGGYG